MCQAVEGGVGHYRIREQSHPVLRGAVTGNDHRGCKVPFGHDLVEVLGLHRGKGGKAEVINDDAFFMQSSGVAIR